MKKLLLFLFVIASIAKQSHSQNLNVTLSDQLTYPGQDLSNLWGWKDPADGKEYALVGAENGMSVVDVTNPSAVFEVVQIPGPTCTWREIRTVGNYAYITTECGTIGLQIVDLTNLPGTNLTTATWTPTIGNTTLETIHSLHADGGKVYLYGSNVGNGGCIIADVSTTPMAPVYLGSYDPRYIHDGCVFNDTLYAGHIYDGEVSVVNLANPNSPQILDVFSTPTNFTHNTWLNYNHKYCFTTDENNDSYLGVFDVTTMGNIFEVDRIQSNPGSNSMVHNTYIVNVGGNDYAVTSWYKDGFTIVDAQRPHNLVQTGNYDTAPAASGGGSSNCWGVYAYLPSGTIVASDITNGLFVCSPTYTRGCFIEGVITDCTTGNPISGVTVTVLSPGPSSNSATDISDALGQYAVGVVNPGTYTVTFAKAGYTTQSISVTASTGIVTLQNVLLCGPTPPFSFSGNVFDNMTLAGIPNANVRIQDATYTYDTITDASGNFTIPSMFAGSYEVIAGKWGYFTKCLANQSISSVSGPLSIGLDAGIYDDFTWDWGWTESGVATAGNWVRDIPNGTTCNGNPANPGADIGNDCSIEAYITGNQGSTCFDDDVDGGSTNLVSPVFDLTGYIQPWIFYSRWHYFSSTLQNDSMKVFIENGSTSYMLDELSNSSPNKGMWLGQAYNLTGLLTLTSTMNVRVRARDATSGHTVEAGFDKFYIVDSATVGVNYQAENSGVIIFPNPVEESAMLFIKNPGMNANGLALKIYDTFGKKIISQDIKAGEASVKIDTHSLASGIYFYRVTDKDKTLSSGKLMKK